MAKKHRATLSVCMIVKNEENYLPDALKSVRKIADQIVVLDTGSSDKTVEIAKATGAEVHHFEWCDHFSKARNESIKYAKCDWIFWMDADERLTADSERALKKLLKPAQKPIFYKVFIESPTEQGENMHSSSAHRLFTNGYGIQFDGIIHEQISYSAAKIGADEKISKIVLDHLGYNLDDSENEEKLVRNNKLLRKFVEEEPDNAYAHFTLGQNLGLLKKHEEARFAYKKALDLRQLPKAMTGSVLACLAETNLNLNDFDQATQYAQESLKIEPIQSSSAYILFKVAEARENHSAAISALGSMLRNTEQIMKTGKKLSTDTTAPIYKIHVQMGKHLIQMDRHKDAMQHLYHSLQLKPGDLSILQTILNQCRDKGDLENLVPALNMIRELGANSLELDDLHGLTFIKLGRWEDAFEIYRTAQEGIPDNPYLLKRMVQLSAKLGRDADTMEYLNRMNDAEGK